MTCKIDLTKRDNLQKKTKNFTATKIVLISIYFRINLTLGQSFKVPA